MSSLKTSTPRVARAMTVAILLPLCFSSFGFAPTPASRVADTPAAVAKALLETDRWFAASAARGDMSAALATMFAEGVVTPAPGGLMIGRDRIISALRASPDVVGSHATWTPIRVGVSADGQHGFTFGYFTLIKADGSRVPQKYMSYWHKFGPDWRVIAYKRGRAATGPTDTTLMPPALPAKIVAPINDAATMNKLRQQLMSEEASFSADAQQVGLGNAFVAFGTPDAVNMGGGASAHFVVGNQAIAAMVARGDMKASQVHWGADTAFVASSGDLGITFGVIKANTVAPGADPNAGSSFFTIWRRADSKSPWRYVAE